MLRNITRTLLLGLLALPVAHAQELPKASMALNWFPEPEAGGFYAAVKDGLYKARGLDLSIVAGGPSVNGQALLAAGRIQFATLDGGGLLFARDQGIPVVGIFATFQTFPQGLMSHEEHALKSFSDLAGRTVAVSPGAGYWQYIEKKYNLTGKVQVLNYNGQLADWQRDTTRVTQNYITSEPYYAIKAGAKPKTLLVADSGFNPYGNLMAVTEDYLKTNPKLVRAFIEGSQEGWQRYLADPARYNDVMMAANKDLTPQYLAYASATEKRMILGGDAITHGVGYMSQSRWTTLLGQFNDLQLLKTKMTTASLYSLEQFPRK